MVTRLASAAVTSRLFGMHGRAVVTAKSRHFIVDAPLVLGGPNEEVNPVDLLLASLASHALFICEKAAQQMHLPLEGISVTASGDFDPRGVVGEPVDPAIRYIRIRMFFPGLTESQVQEIVEIYKKRCPIYATLAIAVPIEIQVTQSGAHIAG